MTINIMKKACTQMVQDLKFLSQHNLSLIIAKSAAVYNFQETREQQVQNSVRNSVKAMMAAVKGVEPEILAQTRLEDLIKDMELSFNRNRTEDLLLQADHLASVLAAAQDHLNSQAGRTKTVQRPRNIPSAIMEEVNSDIEEIEKAYKAGCYRSTVILCERIIEICLHRKAFEVTGNDYLEKNPGIGTDKLVALLREKKVEFDTAFLQQTAVMSKVKASSVHARQQSFKPTKEQAQEAILFTFDAVNKLFS